MIKFSLKEVMYLVLATLALGFIFGFDDKRPSFEFFQWFFNFLLVSLVSGVVVFCYALSQKFAADHFSCSSEFKLWGIKKYGFRPYHHFKSELPLGILIGVLVAFLSVGKAFFAAVASFDLHEERHRRVGRRFINLTSMEVAFISLSGVFSSLFLAFVFGIFKFEIGVLVASWFALFHMIPLPGLDGLKVFFASISLFVFSAAFVIFSVVLLSVVTSWIALLISFVLAVILFGLFFYYKVYLS